MTRVTTAMVLVLVLMNSAMAITAGSGLDEDLGVNLNPGLTETIDDTVDHAKNGFSLSGGLGETLFSLFAAALGAMKFIFQSAFAAPNAFMNMGFPNWFVVPMFAPFYVVGFLELVYAASGREMV